MVVVVVMVVMQRRASGEAEVGAGKEVPVWTKAVVDEDKDQDEVLCALGPGDGCLKDD